MSEIVISLLFHSAFSNAMLSLHLETHRFRCTAQMSDGPALAFGGHAGKASESDTSHQSAKAKEFLVNLGHLLI